MQDQQNTDNNSVTLQQQNIYHMDASEIDALHRMQNSHPELVTKILGFRQQELDIQKDIIGLEKEEQDMRKNEIPYRRRYAFLGQSMAYSLGFFTLVGGAYFAIENNPVVAGLFLTSTVGVAFAQFFNKKQKQET
ncbi:MAG: hypothetical protein DRG24_05705 [Epsilonproteobacteria bacterium]|nr:MAG: hypothetical protein DRG24_05705 [Campylobacterota bacterium]